MMAGINAARKVQEIHRGVAGMTYIEQPLMTAVTKGT